VPEERRTLTVAPVSSELILMSLPEFLMTMPRMPESGIRTLEP